MSRCYILQRIKCFILINFFVLFVTGHYVPCNKKYTLEKTEMGEISVEFVLLFLTLTS